MNHGKLNRLLNVIEFLAEDLPKGSMGAIAADEAFAIINDELAKPEPNQRMNLVFDAIRAERAHQDAKWGTLEQKRQSCAGFIMVMEWKLVEAKSGWVNNSEGKHSALRTIVQIAATAVACLEQYGDEGNPQ